MNLEQLIQLKIKELDKSEQEKDAYLSIILKLSLYFIKKNDFISDDYFCLIEKPIYKEFYIFFKNPTKFQQEKFLKSFENLKSGGDIIFMICNKFFEDKKNLSIFSLDIFFRIVLKQNYELLKNRFVFPIIQDQKKLIIRLLKFVKIKYNKEEVNKKQIIELFKENPKDNSIEKQEDLTINENKIEDFTKSKNEIKEKEVNYPDNYTDKNIKEATNIIIEEKPLFDSINLLAQLKKKKIFIIILIGNLLF